MNSFKPGCSIKTLKDRARLIQSIRSFFDQRDYLEVDTPLISAYPTIDLHLESIQVLDPLGSNNHRYLITSPEYHMKRLLASGSGSIFQICRAFRKDEAGEKHNPEFTIIEWYNTQYSLDDLIQEVDQLLQMSLHTEKSDILTYKEAFKVFLGINPWKVDFDLFRQFCIDKKHVWPSSFTNETPHDDLLHYLMGIFLEPNLGKDRPVFIKDYPLSQACLAKRNKDGLTASRFEAYFKGIELCNGYYELTDSNEQLVRFKEENILRQNAGKKELPIDMRFIQSLKTPLPDCAGVALGLDRLFMLSTGVKNIDKAMAFSWNKS